MARKTSQSLWISTILANIVIFAAGLMAIMVNALQPGSEESNLYWWLLPYRLGGVFGSLLLGFSAQRYGRKPTIILEGALLFLSFLLAAIAQKHSTHFIVLTIAGASTGGAFTVISVYLVEISTRYNRGRISSTIGIFFFGGLLVGEMIIGNVPKVTYSIISMAILCTCLIIFCALAPDSPQYLIIRSPDKAKIALEKLRCTNVDDEFAEIKEASNNSETSIRAGGYACLLFIFQHLSGAKIAQAFISLMYYRSNSDMEYDVGITVIYIAPLLGSLLPFTLLDGVGRKMILVMSAAGILIPEIFLILFFNIENLGDIRWMLVICQVLINCSYSFGLATLPWIISAELQPNNVRAVVVGATSSLTWVVDFLISGCYEFTDPSIGFKVFSIFPIANLIAILYFIMILPETSKKNVKELNQICR